MQSAAARTFFAKDLVNKATKTDAKLPPMSGVKFGSIFTPHMMVIDWNIERGWQAPYITNYQDLQLSPAATALQYGLQCFEGLKAYRNKNDEAYLFRPDQNAARMHRSFKRLTLPSFDEKEWVECIKQYVRLEKEWIPTDANHSLYLRPTGISTTADPRIAHATDAKMFFIASPVGPYYPTGFKPVKLYVNPKAHRAWPGGTGDAKVGPNYAGPIPHQVEAASKGFGQVLWLGPGGVVDEVGAMNFLMLWKRKDGVRELVTAPLDGTILPGITRASVLALARQWGEFEVSERRFTITDILEGLEEGRVEEMFGCGTAAIVTPVDGLSFDGKAYEVPCPENSLTMRTLNAITDIQTGKVKSDWAVQI